MHHLIQLNAPLSTAFQFLCPCRNFILGDVSAAKDRFMRILQGASFVYVGLRSGYYAAELAKRQDVKVQEHLEEDFPESIRFGQNASLGLGFNSEQQ